MTEPTLRPAATSRPTVTTGRPAPGGSSPGAPGLGAPRSETPAADLAALCRAAAADVARGGCTVARLAAAAEMLDAALAQIVRWDPDLVRLPTTRDGAGDLLAALCAAGLDPAERAHLERALGALLADAAAVLGDAPAP